MPILFAITVVAFVALLWAAVSTAQHIRRARRRKEMAEDATNRRAAFPAAAAIPPSETAPMVSAAVEVPVVQETVVEPPPPPLAVVAVAVEARPEVRFPLSSHRVRQAESQLAQLTAARESAQQAMPPKRPSVSATPQRAYPSYFNENMGDLSDPIPSPRLRDRARNR